MEGGTTGKGYDRYSALENWLDGECESTVMRDSDTEGSCAERYERTGPKDSS